MKIAPKLLVFSAVVAASGLNSALLPAHAGPSGPSARMAARLKKYPTSAWLAHYLPDDRYKIAGGVWKYVSTDLDTYYHRPDSGLMMSQPAGRVIGFASAAEAEEAGYMPAPAIQMERQRLRNLEAKREMTRVRSLPGNNPELRRIMGVLAELQAIGTEMQSDKSGNLPMTKKRLDRVIVLLDAIPVKPGEARAIKGLKDGLRSLSTALDLKMQGKDTAAMNQLALSLTLLQNAGSQSRRQTSLRRR